MEPFPAYFKSLLEFTGRGNIANLDLRNVAIGESSGRELEFGEQDANPYAGLQTVNPHLDDTQVASGELAESRGERTSVPVLTLSRLLSESGFCPDVIVMDIEGAEILVVEQLLRMAIRPSLFFEIHPSFTGDAKVVRCLSGLSEAGYALRQIDEHHYYAQNALAQQSHGAPDERERG